MLRFFRVAPKLPRMLPLALNSKLFHFIKFSPIFAPRLVKEGIFSPKEVL
jgi:hypothetical protein